MDLKRLEAAIDSPQKVSQSAFSEEDLQLIDDIYSDLKSAAETNQFSPIGKRSLASERYGRLLRAMAMRNMNSWV